jgi:hypothetical protein
MKWEILVSEDQVCAMDLETGYYTLSPNDPKLPEDVREEMQKTLEEIRERFDNMLEAMKRCKAVLEKIIPQLPPKEEIIIEVVGAPGNISGVVGGGAYIPPSEITKYVRKHTKRPRIEAEDLLRWGPPYEDDPQEILQHKFAIAKLLAELFYPVRFVAHKISTREGVVELEKPIQEVVYVPLPEYKKLKEVR